MKQHFKYKLFISLTIIVIVIIISICSNGSERMTEKYFSNHVNIEEHNIQLLPDIMTSMRKPYPDMEGMARRCFSNHVNIEEHNIQLLPDIMTATRKPNLGKSVFFHETSCLDGIATLNARQGCAIESAALANPTWDVFVLFASPVGFSNNTEKAPALRALESYPNVHLRNVNLWTYAHDTPISSFIDNGQLFKSKFLNSHTSDFLRYLSLYKWGGTYLDLDVIVKKSFDEIEPNYAGAENLETVAAGLINFDYKDVGHKIAKLCLNEFQNRFDGDNWGNNGPGVITRVLQNICQTYNTVWMTRARCKGFTVFPMSKVYAINFNYWPMFFEDNFSELTMDLTNDSIVVHVWNKLSSDKRLPIGSQAAYTLLAAKYCPKVFKSSGDFF
ncbi:lactosylceramide 4-alpha-galactosyltransferase-like isoform X2 [Bradysia coprophila]|nr:lactosylceramide 4-alpha-galactosyltransferase-like isoform X2 [Bradysia coprophila]